MRNCLIVDDMHPDLFPLLEEVGIAFHYNPSFSRYDVLHVIKEYEGIIVRSKLKIDSEFLNAASNLKYVARAGSGKDNIDVKEAERLGIAILNAPEGNRDAVAEHTIAMLLNLLNHICSANEEVKNRIWKREQNRGFELGDKTVGIIGYGHTGRAVSKRLVGFGCQVLAYDINGAQSLEQGVMEATMEAIFRQSDIVSLHIPLDHRNKNLVNKSFLDAFVKPIWLINTARGEILNTHDLIQALESKKVLGAGLDVLENEKLDMLTAEQEEHFDKLSRMSNVLLSPHVAGWTHESYRKISQVLAAKIKAFYQI